MKLANYFSPIGKILIALPPKDSDSFFLLVLHDFQNQKKNPMFDFFSVINQWSEIGSSQRLHQFSFYYCSVNRRFKDMEEFLPPITHSFSDLAMVKSKVLTREEVLRRRLRLVKRLDRFYRNHYWALLRNVKSRFGEFHRTYGKSPFEKDQMNKVLNQSVDIINPNGSAHCDARGCKLKAMVLTRYCRKHILADSKQKLYRGCQAVAKK